MLMAPRCQSASDVCIFAIETYIVTHREASYVVENLADAYAICLS